MYDLIVPQVKTLVKYNRPEKAWQAINGTVTSFPPGKPNKRRAQLFAIGHDWPELGDEIKAILTNNQIHPEYASIEQRTINAGLLLIHNCLAPGRDISEPGAYNYELAICRSQKEPELFYAICWDSVNNENDKLWCSCTDYQYGEHRAKFGYMHPNAKAPGAPKLLNGQIACKHILTFLLYEILIQRPEDYPISQI